MIEFSICLIVTASPSRISSTHDGLARRRAQAAGELGEVVRRVQLADRVLPAVAVDEVVPVGDQVAQRAAVVAERHAALHAARALRGQLLVGALDEELLVGALAAMRSVGSSVGDARRARSSGSRRARPSGRRLCLGVATPPRARLLGQHALVVGREDLDEARQQRVPVVEHALGRPASRCARRCSATSARHLDRRRRRSSSSSWSSIAGLTRARKRAVLVEHEGQAAAHARRRSCARSGRARRRARRSCTRSRGRRRPRRRRCAPELRTAKRSPARPRKNARPLVAP